VIETIRNDLFEKMQGLPVRYYDGHPTGELMSRFTNDIDNIDINNIDNHDRAPLCKYTCNTVIYFYNVDNKWNYHFDATGYFHNNDRNYSSSKFSFDNHDRDN
jgi:hypothetical protein